MLGDLPPSSSETLLRVPAAFCITSLPVSGLPVKATLSTSLWATSIAPTSPAPVMMLTTPEGRPASSKLSTSARVVSGVCSAGFNTTVQPAQRAGASFQAAINSGKFHGTICAATPMGSRKASASASSETGTTSPWIFVASPP